MRKRKKMRWARFLVSLLCQILFAMGCFCEETDRQSTMKSELGSYGMLPIYGRDIEPGTYGIDAQTNSKYFKLYDSTLTVQPDGSMEVSFYLSGTSYRAIFAGTSEEAGTGSEIKAEVKDGKSYFTLPIEALDAPVPCAAFSVNKQRWYDRSLLFEAASLPEEALRIALPDYEKIAAAIEAYDNGSHVEGETEKRHTKLIVMGDRKAVSQETETENVFEEAETENGGDGSAKSVSAKGAKVSVADGSYSVEVVLTGGSGRASVSSPTYLTVIEGRAYATLLWSSTHYDYMVLDGETYYNEATDGGISRFTIPVTAFDQPIDVIADTTAMGDPVEIAYTLTFYEASIGDAGLIPQEAAKRVLAAALFIIVAGGILNHILKRKRKA